MAARNKNYATVSEFGRWLSVVSSTTPDTTMIKNLPQSEGRWGRAQTFPREGDGQATYDIYARKSSSIFVDINNQLIQERCSGSCNIRVHAVFNDNQTMNLQVIPRNGNSSTVLPTFGSGSIQTATFELDNFVGGGEFPDFELRSLTGSEVSVIMLRVTFENNQLTTPNVPTIPVGISPNSNTPIGDVTFTWQPVNGATEYIVSYQTGVIGETFDYQPGSYVSATALNCVSGTCSQTIPLTNTGPASFWVKARNATGESIEWSETVTFTLVNSLLVPPTPISPINFVETHGSTVLSWTPTGASHYRVSYHSVDITNGYNTGVTKPASDFSCETGVCNETVYNLGGGLNRWWVVSSDGTNDSAVNNPTAEFIATPPAIPTVIGPQNNATTSNTVTVSWWPTAGALEYKVDHTSGGAYQGDIFRPASEFNCSSGVCSHTISNIQAGNSEWWVTSKSSAGQSLSTGGNTFIVQ